MERMAVVASWSSLVCVSLWSSSAPFGLPMANWCGWMVLETRGVIVLVIAAVTIRRVIVPHAMGRILPFGFRSGMILAEAMALSVSCVMLFVARCVRVVAKASRAAALL